MISSLSFSYAKVRKNASKLFSHAIIETQTEVEPINPIHVIVLFPYLPENRNSWVFLIFSADIEKRPVARNALMLFVNPLSANPIKWSNTLNPTLQPTNCLSVTNLWGWRLKG